MDCWWKKRIANVLILLITCNVTIFIIIIVIVVRGNYCFRFGCHDKRSLAFICALYSYLSVVLPLCTHPTFRARSVIVCIVVCKCGDLYCNKIDFYKCINRTSAIREQEEQHQQ